ncbi:flavin-binding monooxygenase-like protein [Moniliophthora roreri]|nr:flavin-binding monooxygenase-like protein [Moniliophthora roreri]
MSSKVPSLPTLDKLKAAVPESVSAPDIAQQWLAAFTNAKDSVAIQDLFLEDAFWRDIVALTSDIRTLHGWQSIKSLLDARQNFIGSPSLHNAAHNQPSIANMFPDFTVLQFSFDFQTPIGEATGIVGVNRETTPVIEPWEAVRKRQIEFSDRDPDVLVIGGGQTGLEIAARFKHLDVPALVIEKNPRIGDNWRNRYDSLALHDTVWYDNPPYMSFPSSWPVYCSAGKLANFLEAYAETLELSVWTSSKITSATWDDASKIWSITIDRNGTSRTMKIKHLVFGTGFGGGIPNIPKVANADKFKGKIFHSSNFKSARDFAGKKAIVVGACNSGTTPLIGSCHTTTTDIRSVLGHDIAQDFHRHGVDVTMYQRSSTYVISAKSIAMLLGGSYNEGCNIEYADRVSASLPFPVIKLVHQRVVATFAQSVDKDVLEQLNKVGFKTNLGPENAGIFPLLYMKAGGYYIDVGGSQDIIEGRIKLKNGSQIKEFTETGLIFEDGTTLDADVVVFATGYGDAKDSITPVIGEKEASKLKPIWDIDEEGELNSVWKDSGHPGLWVGIGNLSMCRFYSGILALQIKATLDGTLPPKFGV